MVTSFNSYWGNALLGIYVKWENTVITNNVITAGAGTTIVSPVTPATTKLEATFTLNLYALGTAAQADITTVNAADTMTFYMLI